ncbi:sulfite exporter TauE/SafE family protein [Virgibacillus siamensis]|uniref:Probable membrane transporter protein n=2 Tax=Virgibacillus siamensis TaxID=480071 RepID=A0ABP3QPA2_9BACI
MGLDLIMVLFLIGFIGSFLSGMVGIGGSIIKYPLLFYIPSLLGIGAFTATEVAGISAVDVFFASIAGVLAYRKDGYLNKRLIITMGTAVLVGSFIGGYGSILLSDKSINLVYAILASIAAIMMFSSKKENVLEKRVNQIEFNRLIAIVSAFLVGIGSGIVGAAGAFLLVPIMLVLLKIPTRVTIASSLAITFLSSIGSTAGKIITGQVLFGPAGVMVVASLIAAPVGAVIGKKIDTQILKAILSVFILATVIKIWFDFI